MVNEFIRRHLRLVAFAFIFVIVAIIAYFIVTLVQRSGKVAVNVSVVPKDAKITVDGTALNNGTNYLKAGKYTVEVTKDGFASYKDVQYIDDNNTSIIVSLNAESEEAKKWADANEQDYGNNQSLRADAANKWTTAYQDANPIVKVLPSSNYLYTIGYKNNPSDPAGMSPPILTIDAPRGYRNAAIDQIRSLGFNPADYKIEFTNYESPFKS